VANTWSIEGDWFKNCNCDPGCPCDFNQYPTHGHCDGTVAMRIDQGHFGDVPLDGLKFAGMASWPGALHEGNGHIQPIIDESADEDQRTALLTILSGQAGGTLFEIFAAICPHVHEPLFVPIEFEFDLDQRRGRLKAGDALEMEVESLRQIDSDEPFRVVVQIPGGFEYTGEGNTAETALAKRIRARGGVQFDVTDGHSSMTRVQHSGEVPAAA
jgi:hypothetical protein